MPNQPSEGFLQKVEAAWGDAKKVAQVGINESYNHEEVFGFDDHQGQVDAAMEIGIIAGRTEALNPATFVAAYTALLNKA